MFTEKDAENAIKAVKDLKGIDRARLIEKMLRLETRHFKSKQFKLSGSAGMEDGKWKGLNPNSYTTFKMNDNHLTGALRERTFIKWNNVLDFCLYLSDYIDRYDGNFGRWNSIISEKQNKYMIYVNRMSAKFV
jgi:hypothetical protein